MASQTQKSSSDESPGAPVWMVTFCDCVTLLLTFFVMLMSYSALDEKDFQKLRVIFASAFSSAENAPTAPKDSVVPMLQIVPTQEHEDGSEKPTLVQGRRDQLMEETEPADFRRQKVFTVSSDELFWARGAVISNKGRAILANVASYLGQLTGPVVISENAPPGSSDPDVQYGLARAWTVAEYLTETAGLDISRFCLSVMSAVPDSGLRKKQMIDLSASAEQNDRRYVEIILLEKGTYD